MRNLNKLNVIFIVIFLGFTFSSNSFAGAAGGGSTEVLLSRIIYMFDDYVNLTAEYERLLIKGGNSAETLDKAITKYKEQISILNNAKSQITQLKQTTSQTLYKERLATWEKIVSQFTKDAETAIKDFESRKGKL